MVPGSSLIIQPELVCWWIIHTIKKGTIVIQFFPNGSKARIYYKPLVPNLDVVDIWEESGNFCFADMMAAIAPESCDNNAQDVDGDGDDADDDENDR